MLLKTRLLLGAALAVLSGIAQAVPVYTFELDGTFPQSSNGGHISTLSTTYDANNSLFSWNYTSTVNNDGFWLVVNHGPNPRGLADADRFAILFGDLANNRLTAYSYNGQNSSSSWQNPTSYIETIDSAFTVTQNGATQDVSLAIDVSTINAFNPSNNWSGISYEERVGIWFHPSAGSSFTYANDGRITGYSRTGAGWVDRSDDVTSTVPEPGSLALLGMGMIGYCVRRRRNATA